MFIVATKVKRQRAKGGIFYFLLFAFYFSLVFPNLLYAGGNRLSEAATPAIGPFHGGPNEDVWDPAKYIRIDEIQPGMEAYCLTCYKGAEVEKFALEVLDVLRNIRPGSEPGSRDAILVKGTDERFIRTGPVAGCSGSPVYIDGRLAGALAFAWTFSKDPLYGVTPIEEMLRVGRGASEGDKRYLSSQVSGSGQIDRRTGFAFDFSKPIDFAEVDKQFKDGLLKSSQSLGSVNPLPSPLITSGLPTEACEQLDEMVKPFGLMVVSGGGGGGQNIGTSSDLQLVPGACFSVPWSVGDIAIGWLGTVTEVRGDEVYGFGHWLLGHGSVDLPMATAHVHTVVSSLYQSFKLGSTLEIVGALTADESAAVFGQIGAKARMIPLTIRVDHYNDAEKRVYRCQVANNRLLTPVVVRSAVVGAALMLGNLPPDHMIEYKGAIGIDGFEPIAFENISSGLGISEMIVESAGSVMLLMNNPYKEVDIESLDIDVRILPKNIISHIWSVDLSDSKVKAGQEVKIAVIVESVLAEKKKYQYNLKIPDDLKPGKYGLIICGAYEYERFLRKTVPYRFIAQDFSRLIEALNNLLAIERDRLYCLLVLPPGGIAVETAELPDLPATKALVLQNAKRALRIQAYPHWLEESLQTGTVLVDRKAIQITVEK